MEKKEGGNLGWVSTRIRVKMGKPENNKHEERYYFFLNPYSEHAFSRCPKCGNKADIRKFVFVSVFENPLQGFNMGKYCCFCKSCELIIAKKEELRSPVEFLGRKVEDMIIYGTLPLKEWKRGKARYDYIIEKANPLKGVWAFEMRHGKLHFCHEQKNNNARIQEILNMLVQEVKSSNVKSGYKE